MPSTDHTGLSHYCPKLPQSPFFPFTFTSQTIPMFFGSHSSPDTATSRLPVTTILLNLIVLWPLCYHVLLFLLYLTSK